MAGDPAQAFPGNGQTKSEQLEIVRLRREVAKLRAERHILKKAAAFLRGSRNEVRFCREALFDLAGGMALRSAGRLPFWVSRLAETRAKRS